MPNTQDRWHAAPNGEKRDDNEKTHRLYRDRNPAGRGRLQEGRRDRCPGRECQGRQRRLAQGRLRPAAGQTGRRGPHVTTARAAADWPRSEEHTSELQSLMRTSYAVFCLKKKKTQ